MVCWRVYCVYVYRYPVSCDCVCVMMRFVCRCRLRSWITSLHENFDSLIYLFVPPHPFLIIPPSICQLRFGSHCDIIQHRVGKTIVKHRLKIRESVSGIVKSIAEFYLHRAQYSSSDSFCTTHGHISRVCWRIRGLSEWNGSWKSYMNICLCVRLCLKSVTFKWSKMPNNAHRLWARIQCLATHTERLTLCTKIRLNPYISFVSFLFLSGRSYIYFTSSGLPPLRTWQFCLPLNG